MGAPKLHADIGRAEVAAAGGDLADAFGRSQGRGHADHGRRPAVSWPRLYADGRLDGILGMGGTGGTSIATTRDADPAGRRAQADGLDGRRRRRQRLSPARRTSPSCRRSSTSPASTASAAGSTPTRLRRHRRHGNRRGCPTRARTSSLDRRLDVRQHDDVRRPRPRPRWSSTATKCSSSMPPGTGGRTMEDFDHATATSAGVLDITTTELADEICGGVFAAGPDRGRCRVP